MINNYFLTFVLSILFVIGSLHADQSVCKRLRPCGDRGVCSHDKSSKNILTIHCFCRYNYTGQWCQFVDDKYVSYRKDKVPGKPTIITDTKIPNYSSKYKIKFKSVKDPPNGIVLFYLVRYADITSSQGEWRSLPKIVRKIKKVHNIILDKLDWGHKYTLELYAGNRHGLSKPSKRILKRPKVSEPIIVDVSEDFTGSNSACCGKPLILHCKAKGTPQPTYSWLFNDLPFHKKFGAKIRGGTLTISKPSALMHQGVYRCLASNVWGGVLSQAIRVSILPRGKSVETQDEKTKTASYSRKRLPHLIIYRGTSIAMKCQRNVSTDHVWWFYNGSPLHKPGFKDVIGNIAANGIVTDIKYKIHAGVLELVNTKSVATGIYQCEIRTKNGVISMTHYVYVKDFDHEEPLSLKQKSSNKARLEEGSTVTLTCLPTASDSFSVSLKNIPQTTKNRVRTFSNGSLEIRDVSQSESNLRIRCEFSSDQGISGNRVISTHVTRSVNGGWSSWGAWNPCRGKQCVGKIRFRHCNNPAPRYDGKYCPGSNDEKCGVWSSWSALICAAKSGKCGKHIKVRTRTCHGQDCPDEQKQKKACSLFIPCPVDGFWSQWTSWSTCSNSCYPGGKMSRARKCHLPKHGGKPCEGPSKSKKKCNTERGPCPVHGGWSAWNSWSDCSATCNKGSMTRFRSCSNPIPKFGGQECDGRNSSIKECEKEPCKINGGWSAWSDFSACSVSCGAGVKYSTRICNNPEPAYGGEECTGDSQYRTQCDIPPCAVNGNWSAWSLWTDCSKTCNVGITSRVRNCSNPEPKYGGKNCDGLGQDKKTCNEEPCQINGGWSSWSKWSICSVTCDSGVKSRTRSCTHPKPKHGGRKCHGKSNFDTKCHQKRCRGIEDEELPDMKLAKKKSSSSSGNINAMIYTLVGGIGGLVLLGVLFYCYRAFYMKSFAKDYMPLEKVKAQSNEPKTIHKSNPTRHDSQTPTGSDLSDMANKRGISKTDKDRPPPPPPPPVPKRKESEKSTDLQKSSPKNGTVGLDEHQLKSGRSSLKSGKAKDVSSHEITKDYASPNVRTGSPVPLSGQKGPEPSDNITLGTAILESGKVEDAKLYKIRSSSVTKGAGEKVVKQDSSTLFVSKKAPEASSTASGSSKHPGMGSQSEDIYGGLIGFENAILETGDDQVNVRRAKIQKIRSKSKPKKTDS